MDSKEQSLRYNEGKAKWSLVNFKSLLPMVQVLEFGAKKYTPDNWKKGFDKKELLDSMLRHITALVDGEEFDQESKLHHIGHIMCNAMFYSFHYLINTKVTVALNKECAIVSTTSSYSNAGVMMRFYQKLPLYYLRIKEKLGDEEKIGCYGKFNYKESGVPHIDGTYAWFSCLRDLKYYSKRNKIKIHDKRTSNSTQ